MIKWIYLSINLLAWMTLQNQAIAKPLELSGSESNLSVKPKQMKNCFAMGSDVLDSSVSNGLKEPLTEIYTRTGKKIGEDEYGADGTVAIITDKRTILRIRENTKNGQLATPDDIQTGYLINKIILKESLHVLKRTEDNGGLREEVSIVMCDGQLIRGKPGPAQTIDNGTVFAAAKIPDLPDNKTEAEVDAVIHSHPTNSIIRNRMLYSQSALVPTTPNYLTGCLGDYYSIGKYSNNVIVGRLGTAYYDSRTGRVMHKPLVAAFYKPGSASPRLYLSKYAIKRIIK